MHVNVIKNHIGILTPKQGGGGEAIFRVSLEMTFSLHKSCVCVLCLLWIKFYNIFSDMPTGQNGAYTLTNGADVNPQSSCRCKPKGPSTFTTQIYSFPKNEMTLFQELVSNI